MNYQSDEEAIFHQYLLELQDRKIISNIDRPASLTLSEAVPIKIGKKEINLLNEHIYTGDFVFDISFGFTQNIPPIFNDLREPKLTPRNKNLALYGHYQRDTYYTLKYYVETKGNWDNNNMTRLFSLNQKWIYQKYGIYYNLVKVPKIFEKTFTPEAYLKTATGKDRKINFKVKLIDEYLNKTIS